MPELWQRQIVRRTSRCAYGVLGAWLRSCSSHLRTETRSTATVQQARRLTRALEQAPRPRTRLRAPEGAAGREVVAFRYVRGRQQSCLCARCSISFPRRRVRLEPRRHDRRDSRLGVAVPEFPPQLEPVPPPPERGIGPHSHHDRRDSRTRRGRSEVNLRTLNSPAFSRRRRTACSSATTGVFPHSTRLPWSYLQRKVPTGRSRRSASAVSRRSCAVARR